MLPQKSILIIVLLCTCQAFSSLTEDDFTHLYEQFKEKIKDSISSTTTILDDYDNITQSSYLYVEKGYERINSTFEALTAEFDDFKQLAQHNDVDYYKCTYRKEREFSEMFRNLYEQLKQCIRTEINKTLDILHDAKRKISTTWNTVKEIGDQLKNCGKNTICLSVVISKMNLLSDVLVERISGNFSYANQNVQYLENNLELCVHYKLKSMAIDGGNLVAQMNECIYDTIKNNTIQSV